MGLVGANGAGKTTLLRLALGQLRPTAGTIEVAGRPVADDPIGVRALIGFMPEHDCLPLDQSAADIVGTLAELAGLPPRAARQRASEVLDLVGLDEARFRPIGGFSTGMRQRRLRCGIRPPPTGTPEPSGRVDHPTERIDLARDTSRPLPPEAQEVTPSDVKALGMLGVGRGRVRKLSRDAVGRVDLVAMEAALRELHGAPAIVIGSAGEVNAGDFDLIADMAELAGRYGAWFHGDGAFGLFAGLSPRTAPGMSGTPGTSATPSVSGSCGDASAALTLTAKNSAFDTHCLAAPAETAITIAFDNQDAAILPNFAIYTDPSVADALFIGEMITGPDHVTYEIDPLPAGTYFFRCDLHPTTMAGTFVVE